jgi:hypothetical protein
MPCLGKQKRHLTAISRGRAPKRQKTMFSDVETLVEEDQPFAFVSEHEEDQAFALLSEHEKGSNGQWEVDESGDSDVPTDSDDEVLCLSFYTYKS